MAIRRRARRTLVPCERAATPAGPVDFYPSVLDCPSLSRQQPKQVFNDFVAVTFQNRFLGRSVGMGGDGGAEEALYQYTVPLDGVPDSGARAVHICSPPATSRARTGVLWPRCSANPAPFCDAHSQRMRSTHAD